MKKKCYKYFLKRSLLKNYKLKLPTLQARRKKIDMAQTYRILRIVNNVDTENSEQWFTRMDTKGVTRAAGGRDNLVTHRGMHEFRNNFFSSRVTKEWNGLPDSI